MMMEAYFDESGTHQGSPVICVAGYLLTAEQALRLDLEWAELMSDFGLTHFHAHDCARKINEFEGIDDKRRKDLLVRLVGIIKRRVNIGIVVSLSETNFGQIDTPVHWDKGDPYILCVFQAIAAVSAWADKHSYEGKVSYFFEAGHRHEKLTSLAIQQFTSGSIGYNGLRYHSHTFAGKCDLRPLQAADLLAYEWYKELKRIHEPAPRRAMRGALASLLEKRHIYAHYDARDIAMFAAKDVNGLQDRFRRFNEVE
jgi:hypothetical protein